MELSLLKIVHVSCSLADFFDYDVTRPLKPLEFSEIVGILPESVKDQLMTAGPDSLRQTIDENVRALDSEAELDDSKSAWKTVHDEYLPEEDGNDADPGAADTSGDRQAELPPKASLRHFFTWLIGILLHRTSSHPA